MNDMAGKRMDYAVGAQRYQGLRLGDATRPKAAVVLLPDWRGQSELARDHARHLVGLGCVVAIADLYGDGYTPDSPEQVGPMVQRLIEHRKDGVDALDACVERLRQDVPPVRRCCASVSAQAAWSRWTTAAAGPIWLASSSARPC